MDVTFNGLTDCDDNPLTSVSETLLERTGFIERNRDSKPFLDEAVALPPCHKNNNQIMYSCNYVYAYIHLLYSERIMW